MYENNKKFNLLSLTDPEDVFALKDLQPQLQSPLFGVLLPEIRKMIFTFVLTDYERTMLSADGKKKKLYFHHCIHEHSRRTDTEFLRTCKRIFQETWFMPFAFAKHGLVDGYFNYLCWEEPQINFEWETIAVYLSSVKDFAESRRLGSYLPQIDGFQLFLGSAELSEALGMGLYPQVIDDIICLQEHRPKIITITIDYAKDSPKFIEAKWVNEVRFSSAVKIIEMEFRALWINKYMLALIANFVAKNWFFRREDGVVLKPVTIERSLRYLARADDARKERDFWGPEPVFRTERNYRMLINTITYKPVPGFDPFINGYECPDLDL
ncbi:uncharacterized protein BHQ10_005888 [Talaromyces amestolkiae]|uniref:Uncharacterized protein n=1 Tax=Talaromyces amestolkiae TaxID=1196081 RepID=A0A364L257_TALAM|nr:uncharacterized protein BHQ10_005888 [Talaromyces amestolkiae]RAO69876.1 hypothetical protein BHQ10_005888 [Talaromyces amestolkiae]